MITKLKVRRLRSLHEVEVPLSMLTVIVGPNGVGKSNLIHALELAAKVGRDLSDYDLLLTSNEKLPLRLISKSEIYGYVKTLTPLISIQAFLSDITAGSDTIIGSLLVEYRPSSDPNEVSCHIRATAGNSRLDVVKSLRRTKFVSIDRLLSPPKAETLVDEPPRPERLPDWKAALLELPIDEVQTSSAPMAVQQSDDPLSETSIRLALDTIRQDPTLSGVLLALGHDLFDLDWSRILAGRSHEFTDKAIGPDGVSIPFSLASLGTKQFFPVIVHSLAAERGATVVTEEPEISLHPAAQVAIGEYFAERASAGIQIVITTHSHYLIQGICKQIRSGALDPEDVVILNCTKGNYGTKVEQIPIDNTGLIAGGIPSFASVDDYLFNDWVDSIEVVGE